MRFRISGRFYLALVAIWLCGMTIFLLQQHGFSRLSRRAEVKARGQDLELLEAGVSGASTNALQSARRQDGLRRLEADMNRSFGGFSPGGSLEGVAQRMPLPPPPQPVFQNARVQELMDRKKDWIYMTPEEISGTSAVEDMFNLPEYGPDGVEKKKLSPAERFYESLKRQPDNGLKGNLAMTDDGMFTSEKRSGKNNEKASHDDSSAPPGIRETEKNLRRLLGDSANSIASRLPRSTLLSVSDPEDNGPSAADIKAHEDYMRRYQEEVLNSPLPPPIIDPISGLGGVAPSRSTLNLPGGFPAAPTPGRPAGYDPKLGGVNPTYIPPGSMNINSKVVNDWNPGYTPPKVEAPKQPLPPTFTAPRRPF